MHLIAPWMWLLLPPLAGGLILLYLLKLRRRDFVVPSTFLWEQALQDLQANAPLQKLRNNLLLIVQMLILLLLIAALSRPAMRWMREGGKDVILVIDASASMQSTDVAPSRFAAAKKEGHTAIEALGPRDRMMIVAIGGATRTLTPFTTEKRALHGALDALPPTDCRADLRGALDLVAGLVKGKRDGDAPSLMLISDGALPQTALPAGLQVPIHFTKVGKRCENVGIVMLDVRRRLSRQGGYEGLLAIKNFGSKEVRFTLELSLDDRLQDAREMVLPAGQQRTEILRDLPDGGGILRAHLDQHDDLAVDNTAQVILPKLAPVTVILATTGNVFLRTALGLDPTLEVSERTIIPPSLMPGTVLIADNVPLAELPKGVNALLIGSAGTAGIAETRGTVETPVIADWNHRHPAMAYLDLTNLHIAQASVFSPNVSAQALVETPAGPIAVSAEGQGRRIIVLGWDLHRSDFPLRPAFPIFVANSIDWLSGQPQRMTLMNVRTGSALQVPIPAGINTVTLLTPDKRKEVLGITTRPLTIDRLTRVGVYTLTAKGMQQSFTANLLDASESDLTPKTQLSLLGKDKPVTVAAGPVHTERELWRGLLVLALLGLCVEWWIFHRRIG